jgi:hypothetical protein
MEAVYFIEYVRSFRERTRVANFVSDFWPKFLDKISSIYRQIHNALYFSIYLLIFQHTFKYCSSLKMQAVYFIE